MQTPNTTTEASTDREPHDSIRKVNSTSKGRETTTSHRTTQDTTEDHRGPRGTTGDQGEHTHVKRVINDKTVFSQ